MAKVFELPDNMSMAHYVQNELCAICGHKWQPIQTEEPWTWRLCIFRVRDSLHSEGQELMLNQYCLPAPVQELLNDFFDYDVAWSFDKAATISYMLGYKARKKHGWLRKPQFAPEPNTNMFELQYKEKFEFPFDRLKRWWPDCPEDKKLKIVELYQNAILTNYDIGFKAYYQMGWADAEEGKKPNHRISSQLSE